MQPLGNLSATDVITTGRLPGDSEQYCSKYSKAGSQRFAKKTGVCASTSFFITELLTHVILGEHPTVEVQALSSHELRAPPSNPMNGDEGTDLHSRTHLPV